MDKARRNRGLYEVFSDDKDYFKIIPDARLKLEEDTVPSMPCIEKDDQAIATSIDANAEQSDSENTGTYRKI